MTAGIQTFIVLSGISILALLIAFASLLPYAVKSLLTADIKAHWPSYLLAPMCCGLFILSSALMVQTLVVILALGALIDRNIAYAPDGCTIPILLICVLTSPWTEGMAWYWVAGLTFGIYASAGMLWSLQVWCGRPFITSADILSLLCPLLYFGLSDFYLAFNPALAFAMILLRHFPGLHELISKPQAVNDAQTDTGMTTEGLGVTLLTISYPIFMILVVLEEFLG